MKYGKMLRDEVERTFRAWKGQFISYKKLKKQLKLIYPRSRGKIVATRRWPRYATRRFLEVNNRGLRTGFSRLLDDELKKVNTFYLDKEEDYIIRLKELQVRAANLHSDEEKLEVQKDILKFHGEMVLLLQYSALNFTGETKGCEWIYFTCIPTTLYLRKAGSLLHFGLIKIVKKHNKKTGTTFEFSTMPKVMQQSFFSTDLLYNLMKEAEAMLARLFLRDDF
ncbi:SPX domain-containing protein 1 isoform X1 [Ricinus communis]|uniref:SPX domain-containing protein 1 isoform X1 n=1 Tax=Ricinus communis TaxID=3988 RepID=UPI00201B01F2|nr:SPX domain-containing protein 1 isoform X1 [Ricinus communis]